MLQHDGIGLAEESLVVVLTSPVVHLFNEVITLKPPNLIAG